MTVLTNQVGADLLKILGMEGKPVTAVTVHFETEKAVEIQVKFYADKQQAESVIEILSRYELHEKVE